MKRRSVFLLPAAQLLGQSASALIDASRYTTLQSAVEVAPDRGVVLMPPGTYDTLGGLTIRKNVSLIGAGIERTLVTSSASPGQAAIKYASLSATVGVEISGFSLSLTNSRQATGVEVSNLIFPSISDLKVNFGGIGLLVSATGAGHFSDLIFENQDLAGIRINGDAGAENHFTNIAISRSFPGILQAGFEVVRTTDTDLGGMYLSHVRVNEIIGTGAMIVNGFRLASTFPNSQFYFSANQCIADAMSGGDAWLLRNISDARLVNSWGANGAPKERGYAGIKIENSAIVQISASDFRSHSRDVAITGSSHLVSFVNNRFAGETVAVHLDRVGLKTALMFLANRYNAVPTNDPEQLAGAAVLDPLSASGMTLWTRDDMGNAHTLRIINQSAGGLSPAKHMRVNRRGQFEVLNSAGNAPILTVDDEGNTFVNHLIVNGVSVEAKIEELRSMIAALEAKVKESVAK